MKQAEEKLSVTVSARDIIFECPSCAKSLVVDEAAEGQFVDCPQCRINLIVPPKAATTIATLAPAIAASAPAAAIPTPDPRVDAQRLVSLRERLRTLANQLKELQGQRSEVNNRFSARITEINRDLLMIARIDTSQQQLLGEWQKIAGQIDALIGSTAGAQNAALIASNIAARTRVQFGA